MENGNTKNVSGIPESEKQQGPVAHDALTRCHQFHAFRAVVGEEGKLVLHFQGKKTTIQRCEAFEPFTARKKPTKILMMPQKLNWERNTHIFFGGRQKYGGITIFMVMFTIASHGSCL